MLLLAIITITLALVLYSVGVWGEKFQKTLKPWHVVIFWFGLVCDTTGTTLMSMMAESSNPFNFHGITGGIAILLMLFHAIWATVVLVRKKKSMMETFHKFSLIVWIIWLIPYLSGLIVGMGGR
ncbi:HsmA family protein [Dethiothermospora halolimnae]|uniref:HsmA family protein n=1 Tax=Dethiothermospora halolimnae TaxID=3114390 RepID=UPI003CCB9668